MPLEPSDAKLRWESDTLPVSTRFDDPYYSRENGLAESRHVFLDGNNLPTRFETAQDFHIAELGFGTGLNVLAAVALWNALKPNGTLHITSFERYPLGVEEMARALAPWHDLSALVDALLHAWPSKEIALPNAELTVLSGDVNELLPAWEGSADAWFLDGFAPSRNPEMWSDPVLSEVGKHTNSAGTFATYTAAGFVRRNLQSAGFAVQKRRGFGRKREMLVGEKPTNHHDLLHSCSPNGSNHGNDKAAD